MACIQARRIDMRARQRADRLLVERGLFESRARAQAAIAAGLVVADGVPVRKASDAVAVDATLHAEAEHPWVSRGGVKLAAALDRFGIDPQGCLCLDVGASTGGFTEVLLARGARRVYAVDVGRAQLHPRLRERREVTVLEQTDIRTLDRAQVPEPIDIVTVDVSFISLKLVLPPALQFARPGAKLVALIKPQFEAERRQLKKGILRDPAIHRRVCDDVAALVDSLGWTVIAVRPSPVLGGDGNAEFLLGAFRGGDFRTAEEPE
jgi:23S rRNA (cytidine1920-2'-O)/16S rRNA (cytidine1409-2'-O)-methyltransferase